MAASDLSPFKTIGVILALNQFTGSLPVSMDLSKITLIIGASFTRSSLSGIGWMTSWPAALPGLRLLRSLGSNLKRFQCQA